MELEFNERKRPIFKRTVASTVFIAVRAKNGKDWRGAGVIVSRRGHIITAAHLLDGAASIKVTRCRLRAASWDIIEGAGSYDADVVENAVDGDVALIKLRRPPAGLIPMRFGDSNRIKIASPIYRGGNDDQAPHLMTGHVIATGWHKGYPEFVVSMPSDKGCSGGPLCDDKCRLVGIALRVVSRERVPDAVFALPSNAIGNEILEPHGLRPLMPIMGTW